MKLTSVLVTATGGPTALGVLKCLCSCSDIRIIGADARENNAGAQFCEKNYVIHRIDSVNYFEDIKKIVFSENIDVIIPTMQDEIEVYHDNAIDAKVLLPKSEHYNCLLNKKNLYEFVQAKYPEILPKYLIFRSNAELPQIKKQSFKNDDCICVKEISGHGGIGFAVLTDKEDVLIRSLEKANNRIFDINIYSRANAKTTSDKLVMEYLDGKEYSVDTLIHNRKVVACIPRLRSRVSTGIVIEGVVEKNEQIIDYAEKIALDLIDEGFINIQFIVGDNGIKLIDLNARFCGSQVHSMGAGVNFPYIYLCLLEGKDVPDFEIRWGTYMVRYWESVFFHD